MPAAEPSGIRPDRAVIDRVEDGTTAVLLVGPGFTPLHLPLDTLPDDVDVGTWLILDMQSMPPLVIAVDEALTADPPELP